MLTLLILIFVLFICLFKIKNNKWLVLISVFIIFQIYFQALKLDAKLEKERIVEKQKEFLEIFLKKNSCS